MYRASQVINENILRVLYCTLVLPYLHYCCEIWVTACKTTLNCLVILQKRAIRTICKCPKLTHTSVLFNELRILKFTDLVTYKISIIMFKALCKSLPNVLQKRINVHTNIKRNNRLFKICYSRTGLKSHCLSVCGPKNFNSLPVNIKNTKNVALLKIELKKYYLNSYL